MLELVLLSNQMVPLFSVQALGSSAPHVLVAADGVFLETGYEVLAYTEKGAPGGTLAFEAKPHALVRAPEPVLLTATSALPLGSLLDKENISPAAPAAAAPGAQDASPPDGSGEAHASPSAGFPACSPPARRDRRAS